MRFTKDPGDISFIVICALILLFLGLMFLEINEVTDVFTDVPRVEQPACIGDQIIVGRDE